MTARAIADFATMLDRERDEAFREHISCDHSLDANNWTGSVLRRFAQPRSRPSDPPYCETCERYAESVGTEE